MTSRPPPDGWDRNVNGDWVIYAPKTPGLPTQGWKIHVSSCLDNAERVLEAVWTYCVPRDLTFKFLTGPRIALSRNAKYAGRGGSGKLVTIYPRDETEFEVICKDLDQALAGEPGPYILSDLRWGAGPLHVRYGGFTPRYCHDERGENVLAIEDQQGNLVPDVRGPVFSVPPWVEMPDALRPHLDARNAITLENLPYTVEQALHFSNGGGVYTGTDQRTNERVVLKEARPHAGISGDGADAVTRLRRERDTLQRLAGIEAVPRLLDYVSIGEHEFLVMEHIDGEPLNQVLARRYPLLASDPEPAALADHAAWALAVHDSVEQALTQIHERGVVYGDLHMFNVLLCPDGRVALVDFEVADLIGSGRRPGLGAVGFAAPRDRTDADIDLYALACLQLAMFLPLAALLGLDREKAREMAETSAAIFPVESERLQRAAAVVTGTGDTAPRRVPRLTADPAAWPELRAALSRSILASATPEREDRLHPGDIAQFRFGGLNLAHGAAGVLYALDVTGAGRYPDHEEWLIRRTEDIRPGTRLGLYDGLHGVVHVLDRFGHHDDAMRILDICLSERWEASGPDLHGGLAGMGLNLAHLAASTSDPALDEAALQATTLAVDRLGAVDDVPEISGGRNPRAGLMHGSSGQALLFLRMYERTGDPALLDHAATAIRQDLRRCVRRAENGQLQVNEGWRTMPYLAAGSVGIGLVLSRYLAHRHDDDLLDAASAIRDAACSVFYAQPGLFSGRAGMVLYLSDTRSPEEAPGPEAAAQVERLDWHAVTFEDGVAFPGEQLLRLSMDLATGTAGVLLALGAALHDVPVHLPFLGPETPSGVEGPTDRRPKERG